MELESIVTLLVNNGVALAVIAYFMWRDSKFLNNISLSLQRLIDTMEARERKQAEKEV